MNTNIGQSSGNEDVDEIVQILKSAINEFYKNDHDIISNKEGAVRYGIERAMCFRIGLYFSNLLRDNERYREYHIDMEYNKNKMKPKYLYSDKKEWSQPDLIVHKRWSNDMNLLIVEFKDNIKASKNTVDKTGRDCNKLKAFTCSKGDYRYKIGLSVKLGETEEQTEYRYFKNGGEVENYSCSTVSLACSSMPSS
ncbi:MAG: hypothetical protein LBR05_11485 [Azoarcus sp.]|jgi:hypothetical protein|nr:hypothetical protein [Azoarcus sp.]